MIRDMIAANHLPDYELTEEPGDMIHVRPRRVVLAPGEGPHLSPEALAEARRLAPSLDAYALEADWRAWWAATGRPRLRSPDAAFLGWLRKRV